MILNKQANAKLCLSYWKRSVTWERNGAFLEHSQGLLLKELIKLCPLTLPYYFLYSYVMAKYKYRAPCVLNTVYIIPSSRKKHCTLACWVQGSWGLLQGA